jgi:DNA-binding transcriptional LysR family regulator
MRRLTVFRVVAKCGSFTRAALELSMTQPAVSFQMKQLETELGVTLIERSTRELVLTPAGERVLVCAEQMLELYQTMKREVGVIAKKSP